MILCGGETLIDLLPDPGAGNGALRLRAVPGGAPANCARALARLGQPVGVIGPVSRDGLGDVLAQALGADGVALAGGRSDRPTALAVVTLSAAGPSYAFHRTATADRDVTAERLIAALPEAGRALCLSGMALAEGRDAEAWVALGEAAVARGMVLAIDPNIRPAVLGVDPLGFRNRLARLCALADLVKLSDEDAAWLARGSELVPEAGPEEARSVAQTLLTSGAALVMLTLGARGAVALSASHTVARPAAEVTALVDTVGAGDTFLAAVLDGVARAQALHRGGLGALSAERLAALLDRAAMAAALCCARPGCDPPHARELDGVRADVPGWT
ncbi:MAG: PfkB family carbohydrate kinase [Alkalilacustris sp.]